MQLFLSIGKYATLGFWVLPLLALFGAFGEWNDCVLWLGILIFYAHVGELLVVQGKLKMHDHDTINDGLMVILAGFFYWLPIINPAKPADETP